MSRKDKSKMLRDFTPKANIDRAMDACFVMMQCHELLLVHIPRTSFRKMRVYLPPFLSRPFWTYIPIVDYLDIWHMTVTLLKVSTVQLSVTAMRWVSTIISSFSLDPWKIPVFIVYYLEYGSLSGRRGGCSAPR